MLILFSALGGNMKGLLLLILLSTLISYPTFSPQKSLIEAEMQAEMPIVYVDPEEIIANLSDYFTIYVKVFNLTNAFYRTSDFWRPGEPLPPYNPNGRLNYSLGNLFGFDLELSWDPTLLGYINHTVHIPMEDYPDGVLHEPIFSIFDDVDTEVGTYRLSKASMYPAEEFNCPNKSALIFEMTFQIKKQGACTLSLNSVQLAIPADPKFKYAIYEIPHVTRNGEFQTEISATRIQRLRAGAIVNGEFNDPIILGEDIHIEATVVNEGEIINHYNLSLIFDGNTLTAWTGRTLLPEESEILSWSIPAIDTERGLHTVTAKATILHGIELLQDELSISCQVIDTPKLAIDGPNFTRQGEYITFSASNSSHNDPDGEIWNYTWSLFRFGETVRREGATGENVTFQIDCLWSGGLYEIVLEVRDNFGVEYNEERPATTPYQLKVNLTVAESKQIYVNTDGSVDPPYAPLISSDNITYTFTSDILHPIYNSISIEKSNIIINGNGHTLQGCKYTTNFRCGFGFSIHSDNVTITNTTIMNFNIGVLISSPNEISNCVFSANTIINNSYGILIPSADGVPSTYYTRNNMIKENVITNNDYGLRLANSHNNTISGNILTDNIQIALALGNCTNNYVSENNITQNEGTGLYIYKGNNNTLSSNCMSENKYNFGIDGDTLNDFLHTIATSNTINGKPIYYFINQTNLIINPATHPEIGYLALINCTNITIEDLTLTGNVQGLLLAYTNHSIISGNSAFDNYRAGIWIHYSSNNTIANNLLMHNIYGLELSDSSNNRIYHNTFMRVYACIPVELSGYSSENQWDNGYPSGGNFWYYYRGTDLFCGVYQNETGIDGIGDTPYRVSEANYDHYPLIKPIFWWNFADINWDLKVDISDIILTCEAYGSTPQESNWNPLVDVAPLWNRIDIFDLVTIASHYGEEYTP